MEELADFNHALVREVADRLAFGATSEAEKLTRIFQFVRDDILFGFPPEGDFVKASQTIIRGYGQCNTKGILIHSLCKAVGIPSRLHFSGISKQIQHGFFTGIFYKLMPEKISHSWLEVKIDGTWYCVDSYINDLELHRAAVDKLAQIGWDTGFSVSRAAGSPSAELVLDNRHFSQMAAVAGDHGVWDKPSEYFSSSDYLNRPGRIKNWLYRLYLHIANRRIRNLRASVAKHTVCGTH